jgi:hypothetical protein
VKGRKEQRWPAGYMPAIPFVITGKAGPPPAKTAAN